MKVGITGHRNQRLGLPEDETDEKWTPIQFWIIDELSKFIKTCSDNNEPLDLYTGMASGSDIAFAIAGVSMHYMHCISKYVVDWCALYGIDTLIVGHNDNWKQENKGMQNFTYIPYELFMQMLEYKCENNGIKFIENEESYTSGTSFLDNEDPIKENYNKERRVYRGLFVSNDSKKINADVNGAYQIMKKVIPDAFSKGIEGAGLHPTIINLACSR